MSERQVADLSSDDERSALIDHVLLTHVQRKLEGEDAVDDDLVSQHPELMPELADRLRVLGEIADLRGANEALESVASGPGDLTVRCPHCREPVRVPADASLNDIACSGCGSRFSLADDTTQAQTGTFNKQLGHFELIEQIGVGSFGNVWRAYDKELDRLVAVKIPRRGKLDPKEVEQFLREARSAAQLSHRNIVSVHEVARDGETVFIVSDLVQGVPLSDWLTEQQPTIRESCRLCVTIADALHHAHEAGVIHRDLKPQNIMLDADGEPHLLDFGLARRNTGEVTMTIDGNVLGTPAYMPPEQARGEAHQVGREADIYSLGVILFELLTGELPFRGNARMLMHQVLNEEAPSPRKLNSSVPKDLETMCLKCLEKAPHRRFGSAQILADELRRFLDGKPTLTRPISRLSRAWRWSRRHPARAGMLAASLVALLLMVGLLVGYEYQRRLELAQQQLESTNAELASTNSQLTQSHEELDRVIYFRRVSQALSAWYDNKVGRARRLLDECPAERRHWEWYYVNGLFHNGVTTFNTGGAVTDVAISPDGRRMAIGGQNGLLQVWDVETWQEVLSLRGHTNAIRCVAFSPDGKRIASGSVDHTVRIWDAENGEEIRVLGGHSHWVDAIAFNPTGNSLVSCGWDESVKIWDLQTSEEMHNYERQRSGLVDVAFSPDGKHFATACGTLQVWDVQSGAEIYTRDDKVRSVAFSRDGQRLATGYSDGTIKVFDINNAPEVSGAMSEFVDEASVLTLDGHTQRVLKVRFTSDGARIVSTGEDKTVRVWDLGTAQEVRTFKGHEQLVNSCLVTPDSRWVVSVSEDKTIKVWDMSANQGAVEINAKSDVLSVSYSPNGRWFATGASDGSFTVWDAEAGKEFLTQQAHESRVFGIAFSPDSRKVATGGWKDKTIRVWGAQTGEPILTLTGHKMGVSRIAFSHDGKRIASSGTQPGTDATINKSVKIWDAEQGGQALLTLEVEALQIGGVGFSPDDGRLVAGLWHNSSGLEKGILPSLKVWDAANGQEIHELLGHNSFAIHRSVFSHDGRHIVSCGSDSTIRVWDAANGRVRLKLHSDSPVASFDISPDGRRIVSAQVDGTVTLWDAESGTEALSLRAHDRDADVVAFSPDGTRLVTAAGDSLKIWNAEIGGFSGFVD